MSAMFFGCSSLTNLNLSKWNTAKVTDFSDSFGGMSNLEKLDISSFSNPAATDPDALSKMFYEDYKLWRLSWGPTSN
ncbi:BspA family leucine-rich repeat surface protein [Lentilactobacillus rapi]|uniref:BspA family leucine-rich repeat surface protein n=1 Tax=Lentilactobacillus rapi TaxID=481723 RepID=UPI0006D0B010|nr:BspA family leucine-rich repeat surface protein [Lentilactobacillus rapi]